MLGGFRWIPLALIACSHPPPRSSGDSVQPLDYEPGPDAYAPPVVVRAPEAVAWTQLAGGEISNPAPVAGLPSNSPEDPILAMTARGDTVAMLVATSSHFVRVIRGSEAPVDVPFEVGPAWRVGTIALEDHVARAAVSLASGLAIAVVDLDRRAVTSSVVVRSPGSYRILFIGRVPDGWIAAGYRVDSYHQTDVVAWFVGDDATVLPEPFVIARAAPHSFATMDGAVAPDGSAIVHAEAPGPEPTGFQRVLAIRRGKAWTTLDDPAFSGGNLQIRRSGDDWVVEELLPFRGAPVVHVINAATGNARRIDSAWAGVGRQLAQMVQLGDRIAMFGGNAARRVGEGITTSNAARPSDGAIYEIATGDVRPFPEPVPDPRYKPVADPELVMPLDGKLCILGGTAYPLTPSKSSKIHGAACVDSAADWRWLASPPVPRGCTAVDTTASTGLVLCSTRKGWRVPGNWEWPARTIYGPLQWTLWHLTVVASPSTDR